MAIVVPNARLPGPEVQQPRADPAAFDIGAPVARLAAQAFDAVDRIADIDAAAELREARVAAAEQLGEARQRFEADGNWAGVAGRFEQESARISAGIAERLSPRARAQFDLTFREMRAPHVLGLREREVRFRRDHERGRLTASLESLVTATAGAADEAAAAALADQTADTIAEARAAGYVTAEEEQALLRRAGARTAEARALRLLREDPAGLDARLAAGDFDSLGPESVERLRSSAQAETARRADADAKAAEIAERQRLAVLGGEVQDAVRLLGAGLTPQNLEPLRQRAANTPLAEPLETAVRATRVAGGRFATMTPAEQAQFLAVYRATPAAPGDEGVVAAVEAVHRATVKSVDEDLLGHVAARGIVPVDPLDLSQPASVAARIALAEGLTQSWAPGKPVAYLTKAERQAFATRLATASPEDQLALATSIVAAAGEKAPAMLGEMGLEDPIFAHAGSLVAVTGDDAAARTILQGRRLIAARQDAKPKKAIREQGIAATVAEATAGDAVMRERLLAAADAHFAAAGAGIDPADDAAMLRAWNASLQAAAGAVTVGGRQFGGVQEVNGRPVILPPSLDASLAARVLRAATPEQLAAASLGGAPRQGMAALDRPLGDVQLVYDGGNAWLVGRETSDGLALLADPTQPDGYFRLDLDRLAGSVTPPPSWWERLGSGVREGLGGTPQVLP